MGQKLPKQWRHWCKKAGLRPCHGNRRQHEWFYLRGHGRVWRLNCHEIFECGDTYAEFDRWALCDREEAPKPRTLSEFVLTVRELLARKHSNMGIQGPPKANPVERSVTKVERKVRGEKHGTERLALPAATVR